MPVIVGGGRGTRGNCASGGFPLFFECGSVWGRVVGLNSKATSFADSIDKMFGVSSPKSHTSLDSYVPKCMHVNDCVPSVKWNGWGRVLSFSSFFPFPEKLFVRSEFIY